MNDRDNKTLTKDQLIAAAAKRGDVDGIFDVLNQELPPTSDYAKAMDELRKMLERAGKKNPEKLVELLFGRMLAFQGFLLIRVQRFIDEGIKNHDRRCPNQGDIPDKIVEVWMPRLSRIQHEVRETTRIYATVRHALLLANEGTKKTRPKSVNVVRMAALQPSEQTAAHG